MNTKITSQHCDIALINPKSPSNVGSVLRAAGCYGVDRIFFTGQRYQRAQQHQTDTKSLINKIPLLQVERVDQALAEDRKIVSVEFVENASSLPSYQHPDSALYVFGPEDGSLTQAIIDISDDVVYVPTIGCMNLAATVNVLLYDRLAKSKQHQGSEDLIRSSRDRNNRLKRK